MDDFEEFIDIVDKPLMDLDDSVESESSECNDADPPESV